MCGLCRGGGVRQMQILAMLLSLPSWVDGAELGRISLRVEDPAAGGAVELFSYDRDLRYWRDTGRRFDIDDGRAGIDDVEVDTLYLMRVSRDDRVAYAKCKLMSESPEQEVRVRLEHPVEWSATIRDEAGAPIAGACLWQLKHTGANGTVTLNWKSLETVSFGSKVSGADGRLALPPLPPGKATLHVIGGDHAPAVVSGVAVADGREPEVVMPPGVKIYLEIDRDGHPESLTDLKIDLRHSDFDNPSTLIGPLPSVLPNGDVELTVTAGKYNRLGLQSPKAVVAPLYRFKLSTQGAAVSLDPFTISPGADRFAFAVQREREVSGKVVDAATGSPIADTYVASEVLCPRPPGPFVDYIPKWMSVEFAETDAKGRYTAKAGSGRGRINFLSFAGNAFIAEPENHPLEAGLELPVEVPDFRVRPVPKLRGVVLDDRGEPTANAVVRLRSSLLWNVVPTVTDEQGRFELSPAFIPTDPVTEEKIPGVVVSAFHARRTEEAAVALRLDDRDAVSGIELRLADQPDFDVLARFPDDLQASERGEVSPQKRAKWEAATLVGHPALELNGAHWLNTNGEQKSLSDYRGKHVLLQFWATWCGPCHRDLPMLKAIEQLYGDLGIAVIGVHDNSMPLEAIEKSVVDHSMTWPIVVDHPDGRLYEAYREHGLSGYPSYVLIGPDGVVIEDDEMPGVPGMRTFMIEKVRRLLLDGPSKISN